jgi:hypothetical protein
VEQEEPLVETIQEIQELQTGVVVVAVLLIKVHLPAQAATVVQAYSSSKSLTLARRHSLLMLPHPYPQQSLATTYILLQQHRQQLKL